jgi:hypothetical protein
MDFSYLGQTVRTPITNVVSCKSGVSHLFLSGSSLATFQIWKQGHPEICNFEFLLETRCLHELRQTGIDRWTGFQINR